MTSDRAETSAPAPRRRWLTALALFIVLLALALLAAWLARKPLAEWLLVRLAEAEGYTPASLAVEEIDFSSAVLTDVHLGKGDAIQAKTVRLTYHVTELREGWFDTVVIEGLEARVKADEHGVALAGAIDGPTGADATAPLLPARKLMLEDAVVFAETPAGQVQAALEGEATGTREGALTLALSFEATSTPGELSGTVKGAMETEGDIIGRLDVANGRLTLAQGTLAGLGGAVEFEGTLDQVAMLRADLTYARLDLAPTPLDAGRVTLEMTDSILAGHADLNWPGGHAVLNMSGDPRAEPFAVAFDAKGTVEASFLASQFLPEAKAEGAIAFDLAGGIANITRLDEVTQAPPDQWLGLGTLDGELDIDLKALAMPDLGKADALRGPLRITTLADAVLLEAPDALAARGLLLDAAKLSTLPADVRRALSSPADLRLTDSNGAPATLLFTIDDGGPAVQAMGGLSFEAAALTGSGALNARMIFDDALALQGTEIPTLDIQVAGASFAGVKADGTLKLSGLVGHGDRWDGALALDVLGSGRLGEGLAFSKSNLQLESRVLIEGESLTLKPTSGMLRLGETTFGDELRTSEDTSLVLAEDGEQTIVFDLATNELRHTLALAPLALNGVLRQPADEDITFFIAARRLELSGVTPGAETVTFHDVDLSQAAYPVALREGRGVLSLRGAETHFEIEANIAHEAEPAFIKPAALRLEGRLVGEDLQFTSTLKQPGGAFDLALGGAYDMALGAADAAFTLAPLRFAKGGLQPGDLFPIAGERLKAVEGGLRAEGRLAWSAGAPTVLIDIGLDGLGFTVDDGQVSALTGQITVDGIGPLTTPPAQRFTGQVAAAGLAPMPFDISFQLHPTRRIGIEQAEAGFAGGRLTTKDAWIDAEAQDGEIELAVHAIDLAALTRLADLDGLSGEGHITGAVPLEIKGGAVAISGGALSSDGAGILRLTGSGIEDLLGAREDTVGLLVQALADFHFEALDIEIDKPFEGEGEVRMKLSGANPAVLEGHPFVFNVNLTSDFDRLMRVVREGMGTADDVLQWGVEGATR